MKELVKVIDNNGVLVVNSREVAKNFGKQHKDVLDSIRVILVAENSATRFFIKSSYENRGKQYPEYLMNRDGFSLLVMGFTGKEALQWKMKYINAFDSMEAQLKALTPSLPNFSNPVEAARAWADATESKQLAEAKTKQLEAKIKQDEDKVEFADTVQASDTCIDMGDVAKILNIEGFGRNKIFDVLRKNNIMNRKNIPYAEYVKRGYFKMSEYPLENPKCPGEYWAIKKVQVTQKGLDYIRKLFY